MRGLERLKYHQSVGLVEMSGIWGITMNVSRRAVLLGGAATTAATGLTLVAPGAATAATRPTLRIGSRGSAVTTLQSELSRRGYWLGRVDGSFGPLTQQAVWALQKVNRIARDGVVGPVTWGRLYAGTVPYHRITSGTAIEVSKADQILMVMIAGRLRYILNTSTGSGQRYYSGGQWKTAYTPTGTYKVYWRYSAGWQSGPLGPLYRPAYWHGGYAVHGSGSIPPYPASHGCCRISTAAMDMFWSSGIVPLGRTVLVR